MSRHSKNNTSQSIFTYGQKMKLKGEYGSKQQRISKDSIKKFQMCTICNNVFIEPVCCPQGHVFCRSCVIQFLVKQKKKIAQKKQQNQIIKKKKQQSQQLKNLQQSAKAAIQFEKHDNFQNLTARQKFITEAQRQKQVNQKIDKNQSKPVGVYQLTTKKQKYVKSSFWATQNTTQVQQKIEDVQMSEGIKCPAGNPHKLTLKKLRPIIVKKIQQEYCCAICSKQIRLQKIGSYKCGHIICTVCKSQKCEICGKAEAWIEVESSYSSFAKHNKAQVKTYTHAFYV